MNAFMGPAVMDVPEDTVINMEPSGTSTPSDDAYKGSRPPKNGNHYFKNSI